MNSGDIANQYDIIAHKFDKSRVRIWNNVKKFIEDNDILNTNKLLDAGCGNGKNSLYAKQFNYDVTSFDISSELIKICKDKGLNIHYNNILDCDDNLMNIYDKCICIAVIHHIDSMELQCKAIINLLNYLKNKGELLISVWSYEKNDELNYREFHQIGHNYIEWDKEPVKRYYYIHDKESFINLIEMVENNIDGFQIDYEITWERQNWFCKIVKNSTYLCKI